MVDFGLVALVVLCVYQVSFFKQINDFLDEILLHRTVLFFIFVFIIFIIVNFLVMVMVMVMRYPSYVGLVDLRRADGRNLAEFLEVERLSLVVLRVSN